MTIGLLGRKCGMTRIYNEDGTATPVTVIEVLPNRVSQIKTIENDGYLAIQVTAGSVKRNRITKAESGHFAKANVEPGDLIGEFRLADQKELGDLALGAELKAGQFKVGQYVDVSGTSKGKGYAGTIKRHHFAGQDATHGNSLSHRVPGSIGQRQSPGKVFKGKKMSGHLGAKKRTVLSQKIVRIDEQRNLIMVRGAVPGAPHTFVVIRPAIKKSQVGEGHGTKAS